MQSLPSGRDGAGQRPYVQTNAGVGFGRGGTGGKSNSEYHDMAVTSPSPIMRTTREPEWTPRQREVLDLLVKGRTNGEIASELGISLDGAKWHVSEIITRLGVDTRDEAAEYWRHRNGLRMRFTRVLQAVFGSNVLKFVGATAAVGAFIAAAALVVFALNDSGDGSPQAGAPTPAAESPTPNPTDEPSPTAPPTTPTVDPGNVTGEVVMDIPVVGVVVGDPMTPSTTSYIVEKGCWQCDGATTGYERVSFDASGNATREVLFEAPVGYILSGRFDPAGNTHYVSVCAVGYCGGVGEMSSDATSVIYRSTDNGATWHAIAEYPGSAAIGALTADGPILFLQEENLGPVRIEDLAGKPFTAPIDGYHPYGYRGLGFTWISNDYQSLLMPDGSPLAAGYLDGHRWADSSFQFTSLLPDGSGALVSWWHQDESGRLIAYLGVFRNGELEHVIETGELIFAGAWLDDSTFVGNMAMEAPAGSEVPGGMANQPIIFNLESATATPIELYGELFTGEYAGRNNIVAARVGQ